MRIVYKLIATLGLLCFILASVVLNAQTTIKGQVTTRDGKSAANVSIIIKEIKRGTTSAEDGTYQINNLKEGAYTLIISCVGLQSQQKAIFCASDQVCILNFVLHENQNELTEVIVTGAKGLNEKPIAVGKIMNAQIYSWNVILPNKWPHGLKFETYVTI